MLMSLRGYWFFALRASHSLIHNTILSPHPTSKIKNLKTEKPSGSPFSTSSGSRLLLPPAPRWGLPQVPGSSEPGGACFARARSLWPDASFPRAPEVERYGGPGAEEGARVTPPPLPPPLVCQGPGLYFERSAIFTSSSPSQLSSFPDSPSPGRRRRRRR